MLSDVLPYELPVSFGNARFAELLASLDVRFEGAQPSAVWIGTQTPAILSLLFGGSVPVPSPAPKRGSRFSFTDPHADTTAKFPRAKALTYNIGKNAGGVRGVALMHPRTQMAVADFYRRHADTILAFTARSPFSIRHPKGIARYTVSRDGVFHDDVDAAAVGVEEHEHEYERLRSYFTYGGYSHIYKFHESAEVRRLERRFSRLVHVDVTRCFDSIYTHTISWVTNGVEDSKTRTLATSNTFGGRFDKLMQCANDLETHGILIGPEVSRVFAEIILQEVDVRTERSLRERHQLRHRHDYEIRRFVDDYFIFCSSEDAAMRIVAVLGDELKRYKLYLNDAKRTDEETPLASKRSVAKHELKQGVHRLIEVRRDDDASRLPQLLTSAENLLLEYKRVLLASGVKHADLANYALVQMEFAFEHKLDHWRRRAAANGAPAATEADWTGLAYFISSIVDVAAAIFSGSVSASHSVKLARITHTALKFMELTEMPVAIRAGVESKIASEMVAHVRRPDHDNEAPMHALVLLDALASMDEDGGISSEELRQLLGIAGGASPNAIALLTVLRYCATKPEHEAIRGELEALAIEVAKDALSSGTLDTEATIVASALLESPFQSNSLKRDLVAALQLPGNARPGGRSVWTTFFEWDIPDYYEALQRKRGGDVY